MIITISRGSYSRGKEVAEKVAKKLNYECLSRDILLEASEHFHIPEIKLIRAIHDAPGILDRFSHGKQRYIAFICAAILTHMKKDNIVYHGLKGHFFLQDISHVLKVRVIADIEDRVKEEMKRENITADEAQYILRKDDEERRKWGIALYGKDTWDSSLYDLVVHIKTKSVDDAVSLILHAAQFPCFKTTPESQKKIENMALAAEVNAALVDQYPTSETYAEDGVVFVKIEAPVIQEQQIDKEIRNIATKVNGVKEVKVHVVPFTLSSTD
jgi:cytidylate kinase